MRLRDYTLLAVLFLVEFTRGAFFLTFLPIYAVNYLGISVLSAGLAVSAHYLLETLFKGTGGMFVDRYGRNVILLGLLIATGGILALVVFKQPLPLIIAAAIFGLGVSPVWIAVMALVAPVDMPNRAARVGVVFTVWLTGMGSGPILINFIMARSYQYTLYLLVALFLLAVVLAFMAFPAGTGNKKISPRRFRQELQRMATNQAVTKILLPGMFLQTMAASLLLPMLPLYANQVLGLNHNQYALLLVCGGGASLLFLIPMGKLVDRLPLKALLTAGFGFSACFLFSITLTTNLGTVFTLAALVGISYAMILPAWNTLLSKVISVDMQATGWGVFGTIEGLGIAVGPTLGGMVANAIGMAGTIYLSSAILLAMALFYLIYPIDKKIASKGVIT